MSSDNLLPYPEEGVIDAASGDQLKYPEEGANDPRREDAALSVEKLDKLPVSDGVPALTGTQDKRQKKKSHRCELTGTI